MQYKKTLIVLFGFLFATCSISFSQNEVVKNYHLTHELSSAEKELMKTYSKSFVETDPPIGEVRNIAEWEPMESVLIAYDGGFGIPYSLIAEMSEDCNVTTIVSGQTEENTVRSYFSSNGVNLAHCNFVYQTPNSYWTRDYSPWYIAVDNSEVAIVNFPYNRPRPNDEDVPILMADSLNIDLYGMNVTHTGGNYMCDGYGIAASTDLVWDEETQTPEQINTKMLNYLGIQTYHVTADPLDDYIKHIDCWGKFLDVDKILITQVPETDYRYYDYEALATYFSNQICSWGYPYEVIRAQAATYLDDDVNPYSNSLILNNKVFVPQTGSILDDDAIVTYETAMPGYEIIGVYSSAWYNSDALHCRTHGVADREMLYIKHYPLHGNLAYQTNFTIEAEVVSYGGSPISNGFPKLIYRNNGGTWEEDIMSHTGGNNYTSNITSLSGNNNVEYYILAENENYKSESHPLIGVADPHMFNYAGDNTLTSPNSIICFGNTTGSIVLSNYSGIISNWEKRLNMGTWQSIGYTNDIFSEIPSDAGTWDYRVELDGGSIYSSIASIAVNETAVAGTASSSVTEICEGEDFELSLNAFTGELLWQISADEIDWFTIESGNISPYTISGLNSHAYFRAKVFNGDCDTVFSNHINISVNKLPVALYTFSANNQEVTFTNTSTNASTFVWNFGDGNSSTIENPIHSYTASGNYSVSLTASNNSCTDDIYSESIAVTQVGISQINSKIEVVPNPNSGKFTIQTNLHSGVVHIFNINGQEIYSNKTLQSTNEIDISDLSSGVYLLRIDNNNSAYYKKIIVK